MYILGIIGKIEIMIMVKKVIKKGVKVLFIDDFMCGGGIVWGMKDFFFEFELSLVGVGVFIVIKDKKFVDVDYKSFLIFEEFNVENKKIIFFINF